MRHKKLKLSAILLFGLGLTGLQAQTMYVKESSGIQTVYTLSDMRKMSFSVENLIITKTDNNSGVYALNNLRYLSFVNLATGINKPISTGKQSIRTYPNPVSTILNIDLSGTASQKGTINILSPDGKVMKTYQVTNPGIISVDISQLPQGIYLCRYNNGAETKTIKIIKE